MDVTTVTFPIAADDLPTGSFWETDGSCWQYELDAHAECGYRMKPINVNALAKLNGPDSPMTDFYLPQAIRVPITATRS